MIAIQRRGGPGDRPALGRGLVRGTAPPMWLPRTVAQFNELGPYGSEPEPPVGGPPPHLETPERETWARDRLRAIPGVDGSGPLVADDERPRWATREIRSGRKEPVFPCDRGLIYNTLDAAETPMYFFTGGAWRRPDRECSGPPPAGRKAFAPVSISLSFLWREPSGQ